jgi:surface antigen
VTLTVTPAATTISWTTPNAIVYGTALSTTQLNATIDGGIAGTLVYTPLEGVVLNAGTHELSVTFTPASANYAASTKTVSLTVTPAATTISWTTPAAIVYGTALSATQLNATVDGGIAGTLVYTPLEGVVLNAGTHELSVTFTPASPNYAASTKTVTLTVNPAATSITWNTPAAIVYGTALSTAQLNATVDGGIAGTLVYAPVEGMVLNAGTHELSVTFTPASANYAASTKTVTLTVTPAATSITWTTPAAIVYGTALSTTQLNATVDGGIAGTLVYAPVEGVVLNAGTHELSVTFTPASANYAASTKTVTLTVTRRSPRLPGPRRPRLSTAPR